MGRISIFSSQIDAHTPATSSENKDSTKSNPSFDYSRQYDYQEELRLPDKQSSGDCVLDSKPVGDQFMLIELERPITCPPYSLVIGSRLDADIHSSACRIAFHGQIMVPLTDAKYKETTLPKIKVFKV